KWCQPARAQLRRAIARAQSAATRASSGPWSTRTSGPQAMECAPIRGRTLSFRRRAHILRIYAIRSPAKAIAFNRELDASIPRPVRRREVTDGFVPVDRPAKDVTQDPGSRPFLRRPYGAGARLLSVAWPHPFSGDGFSLESNRLLPSCWNMALAS